MLWVEFLRYTLYLKRWLWRNNIDYDIIVCISINNIAFALKVIHIHPIQLAKFNRRRNKVLKYFS